MIALETIEHNHSVHVVLEKKRKIIVLGDERIFREAKESYQHTTVEISETKF